MDDTTIIIKTIARPQCLDRLIKSIKFYYPYIKIIVGDDGKNPVKRDDVYKYIILPYDIGASKGRNEIIKEVDTEYLITLDDDFIFIEESKIHILKEIFENSNLDILGAKMFPRLDDHFSIFSKKNEFLFVFGGKYHQKNDDYVSCDIITQCFIAKTKTMKKYQWNEKAKTEEHYLFFYENWKEIKVGFTDRVEVQHRSIMETEEYRRLRNGDRVKGDIGEQWNKNGIKHIVVFYDNLEVRTLDNWTKTAVKMYKANQDRISGIK